MRLLLFSILIISLTGVKEQTEKEIGASLFLYFSSPQDHWENWYIEKGIYHKLIERQSLSKNDKDEFKLSVNENYNRQLDAFVTTMKDMQAEYLIEDDESSFTLTKIKTEPLEEVKHVYYFRLFITYHWKKGDDKYVIEFQACYINKKWHMMEPFQEYFE